MKRIIFLIAIMCMVIPSIAQTFNTKGIPTNAATTTNTYGHQGFNYQNGIICAVVANTVTPVATGRLDTIGTLTGTVDTGYLQFSVNGSFDFLFDFTVTKIGGTVAATSLLQGSLDNATWYTLTGNTTNCATCIGAAATITNTAGTKHYQWFLPRNSINYPYYQIQTITTGSMTATYNGKVGYKN